VSSDGTRPKGSGARRSLARRFFWQMAVASVGLVLLAGVLEGLFSYREARAQLSSLQALQAQAAAGEIEQYLGSLRRGLDAVQALPWGQAGFDAEVRRQELQRLLTLSPALVELRDGDEAGRELIVVSRTEPDRRTHPDAAARQPAPAGGAPAPGFMAPRFDAAGEPTVGLVAERKGTPAGRTVATLNLRFLADVVSGLRVTDGGEVYVVDGANQLIAHPDPAQVLRQRRLGLPGDGVAAARAALQAGAARLDAAEVMGLNGEIALATAIRLPETGWLLVVEQPRSRALQPVFATVQRTVLLLALAAAVAMLTSAAFARRMAAPIAQLRNTTAAIAEGRRGERISLATGDELQGLAEDFNTMLDKLEQSYAELEAKVQARTAEARQGREAAERANEARMRFLANASHDLRQPMQAIGLLVGLLRTQLGTAQDGVDPRALRERIDKIYGAVRGMDSMFNGLFDLSKLDVGAVKPQPQPFLAAELFRSRALLHGPAAESKGLRFVTRVGQGGGALVIDSDPVEVDRIVANLCVNAIRYTDRGGVLLAAQRRGAEVWLRVIDTGRGIAPADQARVFDEFVRLERERGSGADEGLGLGLAIVRRTAQLLGARLWLRSRPGRGSCFTLALPASARPWHDNVERPHEVGELQGAFAIVVDDSADNRAAMAELLELWGMIVVTASDADAALAECESRLRTPDVIVTDFVLGPRPDGAELIRRLRAQSGLPIPALLVTAEPKLSQEPDGDVRVMHKPVADTALREALRQALAGTLPASLGVCAAEIGTRVGPESGHRQGALRSAG
jgi:signal transduction histidine kinase/CheY-like chemotaxis protein